MERKNIAFQYGIHRAPSSGVEGELSECVNLIPKNGELVTLQPPTKIGVTTPTPTSIITYIHKSSSYKNYLFVDSNDNSVYSVNGKNESSLVYKSGTHINGISSIGNTAIVSTDSGLVYCIYKNGSYKVLPPKPPVLPIEFRLKGEMATTTQETVKMPEDVGDVSSGGVSMLSEENSKTLTSAVMAHVNKFISEESEKGYFTSSFFVRWAYVMMGKPYMASPPILMRLNEGLFPLVKVIASGTRELNIYLEAYKARLYCYFLEASEALEDWKDIITGIQIYVSPQISRYDQNGEANLLSMSSSESISYSILDTPIIIDGEDANIYAKRKLSTGGVFVRGIHKDKEAYYNGFVNSSLFYKIREFNLDGLSFVYMPMSESLNNIQTLPSLNTDGYQEFDTYIPTGMFSYNNRLNIYGVQEKKYSFPLSSLIQYTNGYEADSVETMFTYKWKVRFIISSGESISITDAKYSQFYEDPSFLFYPDNNISEAIIERSHDGTIEQAVVKMVSHPTMNGSYWFNKFEPLEFKTVTESLQETEAIINEPDKIYTSEVGNPFVFPLEGINTVGTGNIIGVSTATKALSQGQFGQFPLYVFTSDGIWAMEVSQEGIYSSIHPVSRDVCNNHKGIVQTDNSVVFTTDRGLKVLYGSDVSLLSTKMEHQNIDESIYNVLDEFSLLFVSDTEEFVEMLKKCIMAYDYSHAMIHIYPEEGGKHYVYSLESGEFSSYIGEDGNVSASVNDYPGMISQINDDLYSYNNYVSSDIRKGIIITRPLVFSDPLSMKVLNDVRLIYHRTQENTRCRYAIFVSNDQIHWTHRSSLRGRSFKYFRFVIFTEMSDMDALAGMSVTFDYRRNGRLR